MKKTLLILLALIVIAVAIFFTLNKKDVKNTEIGTITGNLNYLDNMSQEENNDNASNTNNVNVNNTNTPNSTNTIKSLENKNISLDGKTFNLVSVNDKKIENTDGRYFLSFEGDKLHGKFCNVLNGNYTLENNVLKSMMISTMMYCQTPEGLMDAESTLSKILAEGGEVIMLENSLTITHDNNKIVFETK